MEPERPESYASLRSKLPKSPLLYNPPTLRPHDAKLNAAIANASLHPAIESAVSSLLPSPWKLLYSSYNTIYMK